MQAVVFRGAGDNDVLRIEDRPDPRPEGSELLIAVRYAGLNPADLLQRNGHYPPPPGSPPDIPGLEVAGEVVEVGGSVRSFVVGDRVMGIVGGGGLASRVLVDESNVVAVAEVLPEPLAAALPEAYLTAHDALRSRCTLAPGETLLVHGATGGVGTAAMQIGTVCGARVLGTSRSEGGREYIAAHGGEPIDDATFREQVNELAPEGVDVILELVGATHFPENVKVLRASGRIVVVGVGAGSKATVPLLDLMAARASIHGTVLRGRSIEEKAAAVRTFGHEMAPFLQQGLLRPTIDQVFPLTEVRAAFDHLAAPGKRGKSLLQFDR